MYFIVGAINIQRKALIFPVIAIFLNMQLSIINITKVELSI